MTVTSVLKFVALLFLGSAILLNLGLVFNLINTMANPENRDALWQLAFPILGIPAFACAAVSLTALLIIQKKEKNSGLIITTIISGLISGLIPLYIFLFY